MKKIIISGASGYIGSMVLRRLIDVGYDVYVIVRSKTKFDLFIDVIDKIELIKYDGDLECLCNQFKEIKADAVIHIASLFIAEHTTKDVDSLIASNITFSTHILEAMYCSGTRNLINTSTSWEHYNNDDYNPVCLYAATKKAFIDILKFYVEAKGISAITLTLYDTYGVGDPRRKILNLFKEIANTGQSLDMSRGEQQIDLIYIDDIVNAYILALKMLAQGDIKMEQYYLFSGREMSLRQVADLYSSVNNVKLNINWGKRPYRDREVMTIYKGGKVLPNWEPTVTLEEGLKILQRNS